MHFLESFCTAVNHTDNQSQSHSAVSSWGISKLTFPIILFSSNTSLLFMFKYLNIFFLHCVLGYGFDRTMRVSSDLPPVLLPFHAKLYRLRSCFGTVLEP